MTSVDRQGDCRVFEEVQMNGEEHTGSPLEAPWCFHLHRQTSSAACLGDAGTRGKDEPFEQVVHVSRAVSAPCIMG